MVKLTMFSKTRRTLTIVIAVLLPLGASQRPERIGRRALLSLELNAEAVAVLGAEGNIKDSPTSFLREKVNLQKKGVTAKENAQAKILQEQTDVQAVKPSCCWGKWGDASSCGAYTGPGAQCNTDHSKTCTSARDCPASPTPTPPSPPSPTPPSPPSPPLSEAVNPSCCWSKWGDAESCGGYTGQGAQCNTDHSKTCTSASDCPAKEKLGDTASCPNFACHACEQCLHAELASGRKTSVKLQDLKDKCQTSQKCNPGMGDWCRNSLVNSFLHCEHKEKTNFDAKKATERAHACVTKIMCNTEGEAAPCHAWKVATCPGYPGCHGKDASAGFDDSWCTSNCNHIPPNCPSDKCTCEDDAALVSRRSRNSSKENRIDSFLDETLSGKCSQ